MKMIPEGHQHPYAGSFNFDPAQLAFLITLTNNTDEEMVFAEYERSLFTRLRSDVPKFMTQHPEHFTVEVSHSNCPIDIAEWMRENNVGPYISSATRNGWRYTFSNHLDATAFTLKFS